MKYKVLFLVYRKVFETFCLKSHIVHQTTYCDSVRIDGFSINSHLVAAQGVGWAHPELNWAYPGKFLTFIFYNALFPFVLVVQFFRWAQPTLTENPGAAFTPTAVYLFLQQVFLKFWWTSSLSSCDRLKQRDKVVFRLFCLWCSSNGMELNWKEINIDILQKWLQLLFFILGVTERC